MSDPIRKELESTLGPVTWADLRKHLARDVIILVSNEIALIEAALVVVQNNEIQVKAWIESGVLSKPSASQLEHWERNLGHPFLSVVVQPYILAQALDS